MEMDFGSSKQEEGSLVQPLVDFESRWKTHQRLPPGFSREPEEPPEGPWMPGTPTKPWVPMDSLWKNHPSLPRIAAALGPEEEPPEGTWMPGTPTKKPMDMDMDSLWKNHPSLPPRFAAALGRTGVEKEEMSPDSENVSPLDNNDNEIGDSGKVDCGNWGQILDESLILEELGYGSSNKSSKTWGSSPALISFTELLGLAHRLPPPYLPLFTDSQEATMSNDHGKNENGNSSPINGLVSTVESKQSSGSTDGVRCSGEWILLQNKATFGVASSVESVVTDDKGSKKKKTPLNKKPRQPKPKKKKLRPKVVVDDDKKKKKNVPKSKSKLPKVTPKTPKPSTPKPVVSKKRKKGKKTHNEVVEGPPTKACKKSLNFELEIYAQCDDNVNTITHPYELRPTNRLRKWRFDDMVGDYLSLEFQYDHGYENEVMRRENGATEEMSVINDETINLKIGARKEGEVCSTDFNSIKVYQRRRRKDQFLTKNMCPGFPKMYKKKRSPRRRRGAVLAARQIASPVLVISRKKRSNRYTPRRNLASLIAIPVCGELPWKFGERQKRGIPSKPKTKRPATTPSKRKGQMKKNRPLKIEGKPGSEEYSIDSLIRKLEILSISDTCNQLVPYEMVSSSKKNQLVRYQAKKVIAKVDLDPETMKMWNLLVLPSKNEGEEMDRKDEKRWEEERQLFRERVKAFLACMHVLQGDRRFQPWKGSVLDSVVGVFLTQNVSDKLSSSAFMTLAALFPLPSTSNDSECCIVEEDDDEEDEEVMDEYHPQTGDQIQSTSATNLKSNMTTKSNPHELESPTSCSTQCNEMGGTGNNSHERKKERNSDEEDYSNDWDSLRRIYFNRRRRRRRNHDAKDSLDWEAVRHASVHRVSNAISTRGMNNVLAARIKDFLDRVVRDHGRLDMEWLRDVPPVKAKKYLLSIRGLGLKSVECLRLLTLHHHAFPVDTNVARITVRLGWVPLQPLPTDVYIHNLDLYPPMDTIQKYLWPRLCTLDQKTLYELHYQMITFGKVFCTKKNPYCQACPLRAECKHYLSSIATRLPLLKNGEDEQHVPPFQGDNQAAKLMEGWIPNSMNTNPAMEINPVLPVSISILDDGLTYQDDETNTSYEPIIEMPSSPEPKSGRIELKEKDIEDFCDEDYDEFPTIILPREEFGGAYEEYYPTLQEEYTASQALVSVYPSTPARKLKNVSRLRTEHYVYELPDSHRLLIERGMKREPCDPCPFLLAIWSPGETADSFEPPERRCNPKGSGELCNDETCSFCNATREQNSQTIRGTILIPCRTAMRGSFPLNGTYFQVNEVFADDESSHSPIVVHRSEIWNLNRRVAYFGTSTTSIFRGLSLEEIHQCFWQGFICVRGFDRESRAPKPLARRLHIAPSHIGKAKAEDDEE